MKEATNFVTVKHLNVPRAYQEIEVNPMNVLLELNTMSPII